MGLTHAREVLNFNTLDLDKLYVQSLEFKFFNTQSCFAFQIAKEKVNKCFRNLTLLTDVKTISRESLWLFPQIFFANENFHKSQRSYMKTPSDSDSDSDYIASKFLPKFLYF